MKKNEGNSTEERISRLRQIVKDSLKQARVGLRGIESAQMELICKEGTPKKAGLTTGTKYDRPNVYVRNAEGKEFTCKLEDCPVELRARLLSTNRHKLSEAFEAEFQDKGWFGPY
jgi:hypothetical protein